MLFCAKRIFLAYVCTIYVVAFVLIHKFREIRRVLPFKQVASPVSLLVMYLCFSIFRILRMFWTALSNEAVEFTHMSFKKEL